MKSIKGNLPLRMHFFQTHATGYRAAYMYMYLKLRVESFNIVGYSVIIWAAHQFLPFTDLTPIIQRIQN